MPMNGHTLEMSSKQIDFRTKWKREHGRMKGANQAWKRHVIRAERKARKGK
tara:strand:- start:592 stop:744 length:153 start_codon:yes stop_codon:yes gene_type:complete